MDPPSSPSPQSPRHLLVRGVNWLGDAVMTTPALLRLREAHPTSRITLLTPAHLAPLWHRHPALDEVLAFAPKLNPWSVARSLQHPRADWALILPNSPRSALELFLARVPRRIGYARSWRRWLLTDPVPSRPGEVPMRKRSPAQIRQLRSDAGPASTFSSLPSYSPQSHHLFQYLHLAKAAGASDQPLAPRLFVASEEVEQTCQSRLPEPHRSIPWIGLVPGAEYGPAKRWPIEHFAQTAVEVARRTRCGWLLLGGPRDQALASALADQLQRSATGPVLNLAGQTQLRELCALLKYCRVVLTNDTGPMHVAAALGTPVVALFGSTAPELTSPGNPADPLHSPHVILRHSVPCSPCFLRVCPVDFGCLRDTNPAQATTAVLEILAKPREI